MIGYVKTTLLLLFLLCVTKPILAENEESTEKLTRNNDSEASKANISDSSTIGKLENTTENLDKTTEVSTEEGENEKPNVLRDESKTEEEKKGNDTLKRIRRSIISGIKRKYIRDESDESERSNVRKNSSLSRADEISDSSETSDNNTKFLTFFKTFLDQSCLTTESFNSAYKYIEKLLNDVTKGEIDFKVDSNAVMSHLSNFKKNWEEYCNGPKEPNNASAFYYNLFNKMSRSDNDLIIQKMDLSNRDDGSVKRSFWVWLVSFFKDILRWLGIIRSEKAEKSRQLDGASMDDIINKIARSDDYFSPLRVDDSENKYVAVKRSFWTWLVSLFKGILKWLGIIDEKSRAEGLPRGNLLHYMEYALVVLASDLVPGGMNEYEVYSVLAPFFNVINGIESLLLRPEGGIPLTDSKPTEPARRSEDEEPSLENVLQKYCELSRGSSDTIMTLKALIKEFDFSDEPNSSPRRNADFEKFFHSLKSIVSKNSDVTKRAGYEATFIKDVMEKYCQGFKRSNSALTSISEEGDNTRRSTLLSSKKLLDDYINGSKRSDDILGYLNYFLENFCEPLDPKVEKLVSPYNRNNFQRTVKKPVRSKVRTKSNKADSISEERRSKRSEYDDMIGWRQEVLEANKGQNVPGRQTEKSSPRIFKKSKIRRLKNPKNFKNDIINLYNAKEIGARTKGHRDQFSKVRIIGHKENPSTSFEVKTGVERDMDSKDYNPRLRCKVRTKGSMSDSNGRTGSSKGHTFSEVPSNDKKALLCSTETSEVYRPNKDVYIKQSVSGKSVVSYDSPDKYIRHNYSPSNENLEIGTSGFSTLNDTSSKNQSILVVSTDSQNADSMSRSETKFVQEKGGSKKGMESSANVEGSIDAILNKNPFITNSRQHSLGMIVENPDKNMESPLPVEKNEKLQTYSKFQRTEDFDINFRRFDPKRSRPQLHHRRRPQ